MLSRKGNMILKVDSQGFVMVPKIIKKLWLSRSYLELKKAKIQCETESCAISYQLITPTILMVPISGQKVMIITVQCHLKLWLTFAHAPCSLWVGVIAYIGLLILIIRILFLTLSYWTFSQHSQSISNAFFLFSSLKLPPLSPCISLSVFLMFLPIAPSLVSIWHPVSNYVSPFFHN